MGIIFSWACFLWILSTLSGMNELYGKQKNVMRSYNTDCVHPAYIAMQVNHSGNNAEAAKTLSFFNAPKDRFGSPRHGGVISPYLGGH